MGNTNALRRVSKYLLFPLLVALVIFVAAFFYFNRGSAYAPPPSPDFPFETLTETTTIIGPSNFVDQPQPAVGRGMVVIDATHRNGFREVELTTLVSRVNARGYNTRFLGDFRPNDPETALARLEEELPGADSLIIFGPRNPYTPAEVAVVQRFIDQGGRVLLMADPTRSHETNSVAAPLGLEFQPDYLFNQRDYDINFQHIFIREFQPDPVTVGLNEIVLYTAGSIKTSGSRLGFPSPETQSSLLASTQGTAPLVAGDDRNVLGLYDLTFLIPPHNSFADNDQLVSNLADFLTGGQKRFALADFPAFFKKDVDILLGRPSIFASGTELRSSLAGMQVPSQLSQQEDISADTIFLGLYDDAGQVAAYLQSNGVLIDDDVTIPSAPAVEPLDTAVITLHRSQDRHVLVVLADTEQSLSTVTGYLSLGKFQNGLVNENVGVYKTK